MRIKLLIAFLILTIEIYPQSNIISNGGFEEVTSEYPKATTGTGSDYYSSDFHYGNNQDYWSAIVSWTYFKKVPGCVFGVCSADVYPNGVESGVTSHMGNKYGHCQPGEYLLNSISSYMHSDHFYYVEFYVRIGATLGDANSVGIRFFKDHPRICFTGSQRPNPPDGAAHITVNKSIPVGEWVRCSMIYKPSENWEWMTLGDFANHQSDRKYTWWDDIKILDLGTEICPYQWIWENTTFDNEHYVYQSSNLIYAGYDFDGVDVHGPVVVKSNSSVVFRSGGWIDLDTGFTVEPGGFFETELEGCQVDPCPWPATFSGNYFFCDSLPHHIGISSGEGLFFSWSPADHLDYDTTSNPLFMAPANSIGQITYTVTQTSVCGSFFNMLPPLYDPGIVDLPSVNTLVTVGWDSDPSPVPVIVLDDVTTNDYDFHFNAKVSDHTQEICIRLVESTTNANFGPVCFERFTDFDNDTVSFEYNDLPYELQTQLSACYDYTLIVSARNFCFDTTAVDSFYWDRNNTIDLTYVPNIITPPTPGNLGDGLNDAFCFEATGADTYTFTVSNTGGPVYESGGPVTSSPECIWDGHCNVSPTCTGTYLASGTYAFILVLNHDCNEDTASYSGYVVLAYDAPEEHMMLIPDSTGTANNIQNYGVGVFPNPANDQITVAFPGPPDNTFELKVIDYTGKMVLNKTPDMNTNISTKEWPQGIYLVLVRQNGRKLCEKKIIIQH